MDIPHNIVEQIKGLHLINEASLLKRIEGRNSKDKLNYYSTIKEIVVGTKLHERGFSVAYEKKFGQLVPDWYVEKNGKGFIVDVKALFVTNKDYQKHEFQNSLFKSIESIAKNVYVRIRFEKEYFNYGEINIGENKTEFENWLNENCIVGQIFKNKGIVIEVVKVNSQFDNIIVSLLGGGIDFDRRRLFATETIDKALKYERIMHEFKIPFVLALFSDPLNGLDEDDVISALYGPCIYDETNDVNYSQMTGLFYNSKYKDLLCGVIWLQSKSSDIQYFHNYYHSREFVGLLEVR